MQCVGNVNWCSQYGNSVEVPQKLEKEIPLNLASLLLTINPKELKAESQRNTLRVFEKYSIPHS